MNDVRLIDANALAEYMGEKVKNLAKEYSWYDHYVTGFDDALSYVDCAPTIEAVSFGVYEQVRWERDVAMKQLEENGIRFGSTDKVVPVVHGRWEYDRPNHYKCSVCESMWSGVVQFMKFCPHCGAKMDAKDMDVPTKDGGAE